MSLTLEVFAPSANDPAGPAFTHTYRGVNLLEQQQAFATRYERGKFEQPNADVPIPDAFLEASHYLALPEGSWRARMIYNGDTLLNGRVNRDEVEWDSGTATFRVRALDDATAEAKRRLQQVFLNDLPQAVYAELFAASSAIAVLKHEEYRNNITRSSKSLSMLQKLRNVRSFKVVDVMRAAFKAAGLTGWPSQMYGVRYRYVSGGVNYWLSEDATDALRIFSMQGYNGPTYPGIRYRSNVTPTESILDGDYNRRSVTLPSWDGWKLTENVLKMLGKTLRARYAGFPSDVITVDLIDDLWAPSLATPELGPKLDPGGITLRRQPGSLMNLAVTFDRFDYAPEVVTWGSGWPHVGRDVPTIDGIHTPPPFATHAVTRWAFGRDGKPLDGDTVDIDFTLPPLGSYGGDGFWRITRFLQDGPREVLADDTLGFPVVESMSDSRCYLYAHYASGFAQREERALLHRWLHSPGTGQFPLINPAWAAAVFRQYEFSRAMRDTVEGAALTSGTFPITALDPGTTAGGFRLEGWPYQTERVERQASAGVVKFAGVRPVNVPSRTPAQPVLTGPVGNLRGKFEDVENGIRPEKEYFVIEWDWPGGIGARANCFDVDLYDFKRKAFRTVARFVRGLRVFSFDRSVAKDINGERHAVFRVRAVMEESSGVIPNTLGPWSEIAIYF